MLEWSTFSDLSDLEKVTVLLRAGGVLKHDVWPDSHFSHIQIIPHREWSVYHLSPTREQVENNDFLRETAYQIAPHWPTLEVKMNTLRVIYNDTTGEYTDIGVGLEPMTDTLVIALPNKKRPCEYDREEISKIHLEYLQTKHDLMDSVQLGEDITVTHRKYLEAHQKFLQMLNESKEAREYYRAILSKTNQNLRGD